ncbi:MAG: hypothetical protein JNK74_25940 [Candidatus Hydrogenedentes bacterium]|nr:hypothetical protein [Candidatus Hydrogenedentota bacterium]
MGELVKAYHSWNEGRCEGRETFNQRIAQRGCGELKAEGIFYWRGLNLRAGQKTLEDFSGIEDEGKIGVAENGNKVYTSVGALVNRA